MKAIVLTDGALKVQNVTKPQTAQAGHILVKMTSSAINNGDKFFLTKPSLPGAVNSLYNIRGVSGVGAVLEIGEGVPAEYLGKQVTIYRQLKYSESVVGTWSEYAHVHYLDAAILPDNADADEYSGSMVNVMTALAFLKQAQEEGHKGIVSTAGNSATGKALLAFCSVYDFPLISIVRNESAADELKTLGAKHILVQSNPNFNKDLNEQATALSCTAIFEGIGGEILSKIITDLAVNSVVYSYGYLGDSTPFTVHMSALTMKNISIKFFSNFRSNTVINTDRLAEAVKEISSLIHMPHFKTNVGKKFKLEDIEEALAYNPGKGQKAVLYFD